MKKIIVSIMVALLFVGALSVISPDTASAHIRRPGPPRVLLLGDSITWQYQYSAQPDLLAGGYETWYGGHIGEGMLNNYVKSGNMAKDNRAWADPDVVVIEYTGNWAYKATDPPFGSFNWYVAWYNSMVKTVDIFQAWGAEVILMEVPLSSSANSQSLVEAGLNSIYRQITTEQGLLPTIDAWTAFGGSTYNASLHDADGLHLNLPGAEFMADMVVPRVLAA